MQVELARLDTQGQQEIQVEQVKLDTQDQLVPLEQQEQLEM